MGVCLETREFAELYCADNGREGVPPSLLATVLLLQTHDSVSDAEAKQRADFDIRWKVALGIEVEDRPFAKSTLQLFRARLILHEKVREVFETQPAVCEGDGIPQESSDEGGSGHDLHPGARGGEGHLQPLVGRDSQAGACAVGGGEERFG